MFGARDAIWSLAICAALILLVQCRPVWSARRFIERESMAGFRQAYAGHSFADGEAIAKPNGGAHLDPTAPIVTLRRLDITAERTSWTGKNAEFVVRHVIQLQGLDPAGNDASHEIHLRLEKRGGGWVYTLFEVRGRGAVPDPSARNPWALAIEPG